MVDVAVDPEETFCRAVSGGGAGCAGSERLWLETPLPGLQRRFGQDGRGSGTGGANVLAFVTSFSRCCLCTARRQEKQILAPSLVVVGRSPKSAGALTPRRRLPLSLPYPFSVVVRLLIAIAKFAPLVVLQHLDPVQQVLDAGAPSLVLRRSLILRLHWVTQARTAATV